MSSEAIRYGDAESLDFTATGAVASGEILQLPDGRAGYQPSLKALESGDTGTLQTEGIVTVPKTTSINILNGGRVYWDRSANKAHFKADSGDFFLGTAVGDSLAAATTVKVNLNVKPEYAIDSAKGRWDSVIVLTVGTPAITRNAVGEVAAFTFSATAEAQKVDALSADSVPVADGPILEARLAIFDIGDNAALDINIGLANATHATDADAITESVFFHWDSPGLSIFAESDDGTTEVAATDTTVDAVDDTYFEVWIDARNPADIQLYIDGVNVLPSSVFKLNAATGPMKALLHLEKTSDNTTADVRLEFLRVRTQD